MVRTAFWCTLATLTTLAAGPAVAQPVPSVNSPAISVQRGQTLDLAVGGANPREARTHFELERALPGYSLLRLKLETGRTHQIRVHLQAIGHSIAGDPEYGGRGALGLERQFLHATRLAFAHPLTGEPIDVSSPLPDDLSEALARAERLS